MAILASVFGNAFRGKDTPALGPADFMPRFGEGAGGGKAEQSWEEQRALMEALAAMGKE